MTEQEQKISKSIIGTLVFVIVYMIVSDLSLASLVVSYAKPQLASGPFDLWTAALSLFAPVVAAYVFITTKIGSGVVMLVASIVARVQRPATTVSGTPAIDTKRFASATKTSAAVNAIDARVKALEAIVSQWESPE